MLEIKSETAGSRQYRQHREAPVSAFPGGLDCVVRVTEELGL